MTFALLLELCLHVQRHSDSVMDGKWAKSADWCYWDYPLVELAGKTIGIIGFGRIGQQVGDVATAFGMNIIGSSRTQTDQSHRKNFRWADVPELLEKSDVVSIHCPLFPETKGLINKESLQRMKRSAFLLNTSRGPIIVDEDLADALNNDVIAGAGIDVLSAEPPPKDNPLFGAKNCIITPHIAWATKEARERLMDITVNNLTAFLNGNPVNVVNG
jgi:glycerate dehydrogenase